jgi:transcriptional regulator with XRE-family HTH domain
MSPLRAERERRDLSATSVAHAVGTTQSHYSKVENCKAQASPELAAKLAAYFGHALTELQILYPERYITASADELVRVI